VAEQIAVKPFPGTGFKTSYPPDQLPVVVANDQPKMRTLVIFNSDVLIRHYHDIGLPAGKGPIGQQQIASVWHVNTPD
jgi:hypothetical protein